MNITISDFSAKHICEAQALALDCYNEERRHNPALPEMTAVPELDYFLNRGFGVAAEVDGRTVGFMCNYPHIDNAFTTTAKGTFSPMHAHGATFENRAVIYRRMYQAAAEKLARQGVGCHAIALYAHDSEAELALYTYGFGMRCVDAIRTTDSLSDIPACPLEIRELGHNEVASVRDLRKKLSDHLALSPCLMYTTPEEFDEWIAKAEKRDSRLFAAISGSKPAAFIEVTDSGENFATEAADMKNICGAYCLPEFRGAGVIQNLLDFILRTLKSEGISRLGVDFESINPTAYGFWLKYFSAYTHSVVRRIDEAALGVLN